MDVQVLLTNDDGHRSPGLQVLREELADIADVTVVAPAVDQSGCGRAVTGEVEIEEIPHGYAVSGTPVDCILVGTKVLDVDPDVVIAGCNVGGNLGRYVLGRSGTVSAAVEATCLGLPAIATSLCIPESAWPLEGRPEEFSLAVRTTRLMLERLDRLVDHHPGGYFNVNVPFREDPPQGVRVTRPSDHYAMRAERDGTQVRLDDVIWQEMEDAPVTDPIETDRGAIRRGYVSVSALEMPNGTTTNDGIEATIATVGEELASS